MFPKKQWSREETLKFVQEYVKHKALLGSGCKAETRCQKIRRNHALSVICKKMNMPDFGPKEAYKKLRNIRSTYYQELKKIRIGNALDCKYKSSLVWFQTMDTALQNYREECITVST